MKKELTIYKKPRLTEGQKDLFVLVCEKIKTDEPLLFEEVKKIYIKKGFKGMKENGVLLWHNYWWRNKKDEQVGRYEPMTEDMIKYNAFSWLTGNLGRLVLKGYLKVIPTIKLGELKKLS